MGYVYANDENGFAKINADTLSWTHAESEPGWSELPANRRPTVVNQTDVLKVANGTLIKATKADLTIDTTTSYQGATESFPLAVDKEGYVWVLYSPDGSDSLYIQRLDPETFDVYREMAWGDVTTNPILSFQLKGDYVALLLNTGLEVYEINYDGVLGDLVAETAEAITDAHTLFWHPTLDLLVVGLSLFTGEIQTYSYTPASGSVATISLQHTYVHEEDQTTPLDYVVDSEGYLYVLSRSRVNKFTQELSLIDTHMRTDSSHVMMCMAITLDDKIVIYEYELQLT